MNPFQNIVAVESLSDVPEAVARSKKIIVFNQDEKVVKIGMLNPDDLEAKHNIEKRTGKLKKFKGFKMEF